MVRNDAGELSLPEAAQKLQAGTKPADAIARWVLPTMGNLCLLLLLYLLMLTPSRFLSDSDTGWHIRTGDLIRQTGAVPRTDVFSFTMAGREWFAWEWLSDVLMSLAHSAGGLRAVAGAAIVLLLTSYAALYRLMTKRGADPILAGTMTMLTAIASVVHWLARPHLFSVALMIVWYWLVEDFRRQRSRGIYAVPLLIALWANLHGSFVVTLPVLLVYAVGEGAEFAVRGEWKSRALLSTLKTYATVFCLSALAGLCTPYGYKLYTHVWSYLNDKKLLAQINEFQSVSFHDTEGKLLEVLLLLSVIAVFNAVRQRRFVEVGLFLCWAHLALQSVRHIELAAIFLAPIIAEQGTKLLAEAAALTERGASSSQRFVQRAYQWYQGTLAIDRQLKGSLIYFLVFAFAVATAFTKLGDKLLPSNFSAKTFPVAAADFAAQVNLTGNLFAPDQYGGYLIYRLYPQVQVFVDGRSDLYRQGKVLEDTDQISLVQPAWSELLEQYQIRWMVLRRDTPLALLALASGRWTSVHEDTTAQVLMRKEIANQVPRVNQ